MFQFGCSNHPDPFPMLRLAPTGGADTMPSMWKCHRRSHTYTNPTTGVSLRPMRKSDIPHAVHAMNDPHARQMLALHHTPTQLATRLQHSLDATGTNPYRAEFTILVNSTIVGVRSLAETTPGILLTGSWIHHKWRGQHIGSETLHAIQQLTHHHLGYTQLLAATLPHNTIARRMLTNSGMRLVSQAWPHIHDDGSYIQCVWYESHQPAHQCR